MITITIPNKSHKTAVIEFMNNELLFNCNLNGMDYAVVVGDWLSIEDADEITGCILHNALCNIVYQ